VRASELGIKSNETRAVVKVGGTRYFLKETVRSHTGKPVQWRYAAADGEAVLVENDTGACRRCVVSPDSRTIIRCECQEAQDRHINRRVE
jgi:hypothetical protein